MQPFDRLSVNRVSIGRHHFYALTQHTPGGHAALNAAVSADTRFAVAAVAALEHAAALHGIALVLVCRRGCQAAASGFGQRVTRFHAAGGGILVGLPAVAHRHVLAVTRLGLRRCAAAAAVAIHNTLPARANVSLRNKDGMVVMVDSLVGRVDF